MRNRWALLLSAGIGAALMYYLDPDRGRRRRGLVRDQAVHSGHRTQAGVDATVRDMRNRVAGVYAALRSRLYGGEVSDEVLSERVRARLGRVISHPGSIEVSTRDGAVTLSGPILAREVPILIDRVLSVRGVENVHNRLEVHEEPGRVPGLQGQVLRRGGERWAFRQTYWSPTARVLGGLAGGLTALYGLRRRKAAGFAASAAGLTLLGRSATNLELRRLTGLGVARRAVDVQKTLHIDAPVAKVFSLWENFENFPSFMTHVRLVERLEDGRQGVRWRWTVTGPAGLEFDFDVATTAYEPERFLAWRTEPGSLIQHAGRIRFDPADSGTTIDIKMTYDPVAGAVGHAIARLFGADPKHQMDDDLMRMKTYMETGIPPHDAAARERAARPQPVTSPAPPPG